MSGSLETGKFFGVEAASRCLLPAMRTRHGFIPNPSTQRPQRSEGGHGDRPVNRLSVNRSSVTTPPITMSVSTVSPSYRLTVSRPHGFTVSPFDRAVAPRLRPAKTFQSPERAASSSAKSAPSAVKGIGAVRPASCTTANSRQWPRIRRMRWGKRNLGTNPEANSGHRLDWFADGIDDYFSNSSRFGPSRSLAPFAVAPGFSGH